MNQERKRRGVSATSEGRDRLRKAKASGRCGEGERLTFERLAALASVDEKTVQRFFNGKPVDLDSALPIIKALGLNEKDILLREESGVAESIERIEAKSGASPERASELIKELQTALSELKTNKNASLIAMDCLRNNRETLSNESARSAFETCFNKECSDLDKDDLKEIEQLSKEVRRYLQIVYNCLKVGSWDVMNAARKKSLFPMNRDFRLYIEALKFIKNQKVSQELLHRESKEITLCLEYLIGSIPSIL